MAFTPEDGTGVPAANSFISVAYADAYFAERGNVVWGALANEKKQFALIQATDYITARWSEKFKGALPDNDQGLVWPRLYYGVEALQMPDTLKRATAEYAIRANSAPLAPDYPYDETGRLYIKKREEVGPIVEETSYSSSSADSLYTFRSYPVPDNLIRGLLNSGGTGGQLMRN